MAITNFHGTFHYLYIFLLISPLTISSPDSDALLKLKRSFTNVNVLDSWKAGTEPCSKNKNWFGILCQNGLVSGLRLSHLGLSGNVDIDALVSISGLRSISIMSNGFSGPIPDFNRLGALRGLYIAKNLFSGEIKEDYFSRIVGLRKVWLSGNNFTGSVPSSLVLIKRLIELHMENNQFSGTIPPLQQHSLISLDLSNNNLEGEIPPSLNRFGVNSFKGNKGLCGEKLNVPCHQLLNHPVQHQTPANAFQISLWVLVASFVLLLFMISAILAMRRKQERYKMMVMENLDPSLSLSLSKKDEACSTKGSSKGSRSIRVGSLRNGSLHKKGFADLVIMNNRNGEFGLADLMKAAAEVLGNGALGSSYKAKLVDGLTVVVKRMKEMRKIGKEQFDCEMRRLGRLEHKNVLTPLAFHYRKEEKLLVYEYQPKGSLLFLLHGDRGISAELTWPIRLKIILGIAQGLHYLHTQLSSLDLPHGDLKSSNILLTPKCDPLLTDYGYASLLSSSRAAQSLTAYKSPEAILDQNISPKCDVFCLGLVILEILTRKFPSHYVANGKGGTDVVQWAKSSIAEGKETDILDPNISNEANALGEMVQLIHIGAACTESNPDKRLDIAEAIMRIEGVCAGVTSHSFHVLPSLRDGFADQPHSSVQSPTGRRQDGFGGHSRHKSVTFVIPD